MNLHLHLAGEWVLGFNLLQIFHKCSIGVTAGSVVPDAAPGPLPPFRCLLDLACMTFNAYRIFILFIMCSGHAGIS